MSSKIRGTVLIFDYVTVMILDRFFLEFFQLWKGRVKVLDYNEEIAKFQPSLEIEQAEEAIYNNELTDIVDIINMLMRQSDEDDF